MVASIDTERKLKSTSWVNSAEYFFLLLLTPSYLRIKHVELNLIQVINRNLSKKNNWNHNCKTARDAVLFVRWQNQNMKQTARVLFALQFYLLLGQIQFSCFSLGKMSFHIDLLWRIKIELRPINVNDRFRWSKYETIAAKKKQLLR